MPLKDLLPLARGLVAKTFQHAITFLEKPANTKGYLGAKALEQLSRLEQSAFSQTLARSPVPNPLSVASAEYFPEIRIPHTRQARSWNNASCSLEVPAGYGVASRGS